MEAMLNIDPSSKKWLHCLTALAVKKSVALTITIMSVIHWFVSVRSNAENFFFWRTEKLSGMIITTDRRQFLENLYYLSNV